jgi:D-alanine-D-alanine ligase-like ATP-grasp enzyme
MKLNWNALHKGKVIDCPAEPADADVVYQRLVHNETEDGYVEDMRVPIFRDHIPFVYLKYRSVENRLVDRVHTNTKAVIAEVDDRLSGEEQRHICLFSKKMGLDYCEVDVLRDRDSGRIYIVDANNTPSGPPSPISDGDGKIAVVRLAKAFQEAFGV